jgi:hypothetical protein
MPLTRNQLLSLRPSVHPSAPSLAEIIGHVHIEHRADAGEGVNHHADERPIAQAGERVRIDGRDKRPRFLAVKHSRLTAVERTMGSWDSKELQCAFELSTQLIMLARTSASLPSCRSQCL